VLSPLGRNFYLNITPNNLVHLYLRADSVPEGSPTSVRVRELSSRDWQSPPITDANDSLRSRKRLPNIQPSVTNCYNGRMSTDRVTPSFHHGNFDTNTMRKHPQSLSEIVTSLRNCNSVGIQAPNLSGISVTSAPGSAVPLSSLGNLPQLNSPCRMQAAPLKVHNRSDISMSNHKHDSHSPAIPGQTSTMSEPQFMRTPNQAAGAKFRFKRTSSTPVSSQVRSPVAVQPTLVPYSRCSATVTATHHRDSLTSTTASTRATAVRQTSNTAVDDMWDAGAQSSFHFHFYCK